MEPAIEIHWMFLSAGLDSRYNRKEVSSGGMLELCGRGKAGELRASAFYQPVPPLVAISSPRLYRDRDVEIVFSS